jgi:hypothetical protein
LGFASSLRVDAHWRSSLPDCFPLLSLFVSGLSGIAFLGSVVSAALRFALPID